MYRNLTASVILFCIVSLLVGLPFALAQSDTENYKTTLEAAKDDVTNVYLEEENIETQYGEVLVLVTDLLGQWSGNENSIIDNTWSIINTVAATLISEIIRYTNDDEDKSPTQQLIEHCQQF